MRKIKEVLRLDSLGLTQRQIARSCSIGQSTVSEYLKAAESARLGWPEVVDWDEARLAAAVIPKGPARPQPEPEAPLPSRRLHLTQQAPRNAYRSPPSPPPQQRCVCH